MAEYGGDGRQSFIVVREGRGGKGWRSFDLELHSVLQNFHSIYGGECRPHTNGDAEKLAGVSESLKTRNLEIFKEKKKKRIKEYKHMHS